MDRRQFLTVGMGGILLAAVAPAIVRADSLMRIIPRDTTILRGVEKVSIRFDHPDGVQHCTSVGEACTAAEREARLWQCFPDDSRVTRRSFYVPQSRT